MESVSSLVKKMLNQKPFLLEAFERGILSYGNLAAEFRPSIESVLEKEVKDSAIVMALRRYYEELSEKDHEPMDKNLSCEIVMKTNICDFNVKKSEELLIRLKELYGIVNIARGDFLNITIGNDEISIAVSDKYEDTVRSFLLGTEDLDFRDGLVSLTLIFSGDFLHTPGIIYQALRKLAWENINVYEIISTMTELTVVIARDDSIKGYEALQDFITEPRSPEPSR
jgi:aspartokinase